MVYQPILYTSHKFSVQVLKGACSNVDRYSHIFEFRIHQDQED